MQTTEDLSTKAWDAAHAIAKKLTETDTDVNELTKAISYLRAYQNQENAGNQFFAYLGTLVNNGKQIGHGNRTIDYYRNIKSACELNLKTYSSDAATMLQILGWAARLMRYYKKDPLEIGELPPPNEVPGGVKPDEPRVPQRKFQQDDIIAATVASIQGKSIKYQIEGFANKIEEKSDKLAQALKQGQAVKVRVTEIKEDGSLKKVRYAPDGGG